MSLRLEARPFRLQLRAPLATAHGRRTAVEGLRLLLKDTSGGFGLGEVTPLPEFGTETFPAAEKALASLRLGPAPTTAEGLSEAFSLPAGSPATRAGVEMAFLDFLARQKGVALGRLLGASDVHPVEVNALLSKETPHEASLEARAFAAAGFRTLKLKVGMGPEPLDSERLRAVRDAVGPGIRLRVDANGAWTEAEARVRLAPLLAVGLEYVEQPVLAEDIAGLRRLRALLPVAADEALGTEGAFAALLEGAEGPAADVLVLKLPVLGGLLPALRLARRARALGVGAVVTSAMDGAVGRAAGAHLALALGGPFAHGLVTGLLLLEDPGALPLLSGALALTDAPGLGIAPEALGW
jgi:o-succinylbenzoate synthase